jgi:hypothetical protein
VRVDKPGQYATVVSLEDLAGWIESPVMVVFFANEYDATVLAAHDRAGPYGEFCKVPTPSSAAPGRRYDLVGASDEKAHPPFSELPAAGRWKAASCGVEGSSRSRRLSSSTMPSRSSTIRLSSARTSRRRFRRSVMMLSMF